MQYATTGVNTVDMDVISGDFFLFPLEPQHLSAVMACTCTCMGFSAFTAADSHVSLVGAPATFCETVAVVRLTSCKQAEPDAALGQMTVKAKARSAASVMARLQQFNKKRDVFAVV